MNLKNKNYHSKKRLIIAIVLAVIIGGFLLVARHFKTWPFASAQNNSSYNDQPATPEQKKTGQDAKAEFEKRPTEASIQQQAANGVTSPQAAENITMIITSVHQSAELLETGTMIQTIDNSGTCKIKLVQQPKATELTTTTITMGSYSSCQGANIDTTGFTKGTATLSIEYIGSNNQNALVSQEVTLQ